MDEVFQDPTPFSKGLELKDLMTSGAEFKIDMDFKKKCSSTLINGDDDLFPDFDDEDDSDSGDILKMIEETTDSKLLASPEYMSFEELASKMVDIVPSGDVKMSIIEEGDGPLVPVDAEVTIHYAAYWEKATIPFDSTLTMNCGEPLRLRLGTGRILPGLEIGLTAIKGPTARFLLLVQPAMAWGKMGVPPRIKPLPALFVIVLYKVTDQYAIVRFNDLPSHEQMKFEVTKRTVTALHTKAKDQFKKQKYMKCIQDYQQAINVLNLSHPQNDEEKQEVKKLKINSLLNLAVCYSKINKPKKVIQMLENLDFLIDVDNHCKALFYYGKANELLGKTELAIDYYRKALKLEPKNKDIGQALDKIDGYLKSSVVKEKEMWQNVFKSEPKKSFDVDEDFQNGVRGLFEDLAGNKEYAKFDLPPNLKKDEIEFVKNLAEEFKGLIVHEEGEGRKRKVTIVKKLL